MNVVPTPSSTPPAQIRDADEPKRKPTMFDNVGVFTVRWYLRVAGPVLVVYAFLITLSNRPSLESFLLINVPLMLLGITSFIGSYFIRREAVLKVVSLFVALLSGVVLLSPFIKSALTNFIVSTGIDQLRAELVTALLFVCVAAMIGGFVGRRKWGAITGAWIAFWFGYLANFIQLEMNPAH